MSKSSERITEKRTVITSSSSAYDDGDDSIYYKSGIQPRQSTVVSRSSVGGPSMRSSIGGGGSGGTVYSRTVEYGIGRSAGMHGLSPGGYEKVSNSGVQTVKSSREKEKKDMQDLNERFANYIEKVRFLEAQNRKLASELENLKTKWGKETSAIKSMYEQELAEARKLIDDLTKDKNKLEIQNSSLQEDMNNLRRQMDDLKKYHAIDQEQINKLNQQLSDYESEINMLRRTISSLETERGRDKERINKLQSEVDRLRIDLNNETLNHLDAENRRQTLEEEMEFLKKVHEQELKELAALAYRDTTEENREFWKSELSQAIRDIQSEYDNKVDQLRGDMESYYNLKVQEFRTGATKQNMEVTHVKEENKKLVKNISDLKGRLADLEGRNAQLESQYNSLLREYESIQSEHTMETVKLKEEITNLRSEMEAILVELQSLMDAKLSLELEIAAYRKLLESEESSDLFNRVGMRNVIEQSMNTQSRGAAQLSEMISEYETKGDSHSSMKMMRGEVSAKTTYQKTSTGPVSIAEVHPEGKYITLENTSAQRREINLDGWKLKRELDGQKEYVYTFKNFILKPNKSVKIFARGFASDAGINDLVFRDYETWGVGSNVQTSLINENREEKATHRQKTAYN
ncbi:70 kDa neurofilament protein-like isoform X4 [Mytilus trossulus]|uniref:70 kDa neurofilament protein-like isoform X4 n=1 Tax=Mytilus trossulus TaxID=6551 RepID=UPI0030072D23